MTVDMLKDTVDQLSLLDMEESTEMQSSFWGWFGYWTEEESASSGYSYPYSSISICGYSSSGSG